MTQKVSLANAENAHRLFRGAAEAAKLMRATALCLDLAAAGLSSAALLGAGSDRLEVAQPLVALLLVVIAASLRLAGSQGQAFASRCRRVSAAAYAAGIDFGGKTLVDLEADAPFLSERLSRRLPDQRLDEYYAARAATTEERLQEIYAHSALFTWRLLRASGWVSSLLAAVLLLGAIVIFYMIGALAQATEVALTALDVLCGLVLARLWVGTLEGAVRYLTAAAEVRRVWDRLMEAGSEATDRVRDLTIEYDILRASQPPVPTLAYRLWRGRATAAWQAS
ncbi:MAG: hypothetical protein OEY14_05090 [Myxococcales bacterium]|nr:hypothetical protein [Myxococcales bacterium]